MMTSNLLFLNLGGSEVFFILLIVLLFFGSSRIPELARGLGKGMRDFKDAMNGIEKEVREADRQPSQPKQPEQIAEPNINTVVESREQKPDQA